MYICLHIYIYTYTLNMQTVSDVLEKIINMSSNYMNLAKCVYRD